MELLDEAPIEMGEERPSTPKTWRVTPSQDKALQDFVAAHQDYIPNMTALIDEAVREYMQRRGARYPVTRFRRPW